MAAVFEEFPKIARLNRECVISEKIDGTNGQIIISEDGEVLFGTGYTMITAEGIRHIPMADVFIRQPDRARR